MKLLRDVSEQLRVGDPEHANRRHYLFRSLEFLRAAWSLLAIAVLT